MKAARVRELGELVYGLKPTEQGLFGKPDLHNGVFVCECTCDVYVHVHKCVQMQQG